jgi:hypothetical protein
MDVILGIRRQKVKKAGAGQAKTAGRRAWATGKNVKMAARPALPCFYICHIMNLTMKNKGWIAWKTDRAVFCGNPRFIGQDK